MGPDGTAPGARGRGPGQNLSPGQRQELGFEAYTLSVVHKLTYRQIAARLGLNKDTVGPLIKEEKARRRLEHRDEIQDSAAVYDEVQREAWERLGAFPNSRASMVVVGLLNNVLNARTRKDALFGHDAPKELDITRRNIDLSGVPQDLLDRHEANLEAIMRHAQTPSDN